MTTTGTPLSRYPKPLAGGLTVRPLRPEDESALVDFFRRIPVEERRLFKDDVTRPAVIQGWIRNLNYENILPLLAFDGRRVVADATLHRDRRGWSRHVAKIRITLAPALRVALLHAEVLDVQKGARALFEDLGFECVATLPQHAIDFAGHVHDVLVYCLVVTPPERVAAEIAPVGEDADTGGAD